MSGKVVLVGAGPGDPGLLTIKGRRAIEAADVVVCDRLVSPVLRNMIPATAEMIDAGKRASHHPVPQEEINRILVEKALEGKRVVRLKGGDPFLFGRGGEEIEALITNSIEFEVVPGVTSAIAVPAYGGIPVTHRDCCSSLHIITGHARGGEELNIDYEALIRTGGTLVFLMGVTAAGEICKGLADAGMSPDMPACMIEQGTLPLQRRVDSTVEGLPVAAQREGIQSPAIIVIGQVCTLADSFDWYGRLPLKGKSVVVTRPRERTGTLVHRLLDLGARVLEYPCIETIPIEPCPALEEALTQISEYEWLALTSPAGAELVVNTLYARGVDARALGGVKLAAIGGGTAAELKKCGLVADFVPESYSAGELGRELGSRVQGKVLIARAENGSPDLTAEFDRAGVSYDDIPIYRTAYRSGEREALRELMSGNEKCIVTFTSASTVRGFAESAGKDFSLDRVIGICIGHQTAAEAARYGIETTVAERATIDDLIKAVLVKVGE